MNIEEELEYIEENHNPFIRATAFTKIVSYLEEKLEKDTCLAHNILARAHLKKAIHTTFYLNVLKKE